MAPRELNLKPQASLTSSDFADMPLWAGYYEPDDVNAIVHWGFPEAEVRAALNRVNWEEDHFFPLPVEAAESHWGRGKLYAVTATFPDDTEHSGYVGEGRDYLVVFIEGEQHVLSALLPDISHGLLLPIRVNNGVTGEQWTFSAA